MRFFLTISILLGLIGCRCECEVVQLWSAGPHDKMVMKDWVYSEYSYKQLALDTCFSLSDEKNKVGDARRYYCVVKCAPDRCLKEKDNK
jgi:hypothetical protein